MAKKLLGINFHSDETRRQTLTSKAFQIDGSLEERMMNARAVQHPAIIYRHLGKYETEDRAKLELLCQHYGIEDSPHKFYELALKLARELHPEPRKRGRKTKWTGLAMGALLVEIDRIKSTDDPLHGVEWACGQLAKTEPWLSFLETKDSNNFASDPAEALRKVYYEFRDHHWVKLFRESFIRYESEGRLEEWENLVISLLRDYREK